MLKAALIIQKCPAGDFDVNLATTVKLTRSAVKKGANIVIFPEMNLTGYVSNGEIRDICRPIDKDLTNVFSNLAQKHKINILVGLAEKSSSNKIYATHLNFNCNGTFDKYRKIHTSPFEKNYFSHGNDILLFDYLGFKCGVQLCYDAHFPELSLAMAMGNADIIIIPHASPRGTPEEKYNSWIRHLRARAFDNSVYIAACNQTGDNGKGLVFPGICLLIGPDGNIIYKSVDGKEGILMIEFSKAALEHVRSHKMRYFLPNRRNDLFKF